jgi:hypothetical protein
MHHPYLRHHLSCSGRHRAGPRLGEAGPRAGARPVLSVPYAKFTCTSTTVQQARTDHLQLPREGEEASNSSQRYLTITPALKQPYRVAVLDSPISPVLAHQSKKHHGPFAPDWNSGRRKRGQGRLGAGKKVAGARARRGSSIIQGEERKPEGLATGARGLRFVLLFDFSFSAWPSPRRKLLDTCLEMPEILRRYWLGVLDVFPLALFSGGTNGVFVAI